MGCICSKVMVRSLSFKEDLNQSLHGRTNSLHGLEELFISSNANDELFPLVCTFSTKENKFPTGSFIQESNKSHGHDSDELLNTEAANKPWELVTGSKEQGEGKCVQQETQLLLVSPPEAMECPDFNMTERSKSCHWSLAGNEVLPLALEISDGVQEMGFNCSNNGVARCRSFHTVQEYDAMVERIWFSRLQQTGFDADDAVTKILLHQSVSESSSEESHHNDHTDSDIQANQRTQSVSESSSEESHHNDHTDSDIQANQRTEETGNALETKEVILDTCGSCSTAGDEPKRKAIGKRLRSLSIPSTIEFPVIASLREWIPAGRQTDSPGAHDTPKFGTYALPTTGTETQTECRGCLPFSPELVAAFEEGMKQLEAEEASILQQISEPLEEDSTNGKLC